MEHMNRDDREAGSNQSRRYRREYIADSNRQLDIILEESIPSVTLDMDAQQPDLIFKALRPVPEFDGNPNVLIRFIKICDQLVASFMTTEPNGALGNLCLLNGILNKITGQAATIINSNGVPDTWLGIRESLINNFADQRDETALYNDLSLAVQGNRTPQEFYDYCQTLCSTIMTYVSLHETIATSIESKRVLYKKLTMQAFVRGLQEPLGSRIRCMRPSTIEQALQYVQEELNVIYLQQRNTDVQPRAQNFKAQPPAFIPPQPRVLYQAPPPAMLPANIQRPSPQVVTQPQPQLRPPGQHNQPPVRIPTRTQQMFSAPPPNYNARSNAFRLPPRPTFQYQNFGPRPMSGVQHFTPRALPPTTPRLSGHDWSRHGNPPPTNYLKSREMNLNECEGYPNYHYDPDDSYGTFEYEYSGYDQDYPEYVPDYNYEVEEVRDVNYMTSEPQPSTSHEENFQKISITDKPK